MTGGINTHAPLVAGISIYSPPLLRLLTLKTYFAYIYIFYFCSTTLRKLMVIVVVFIGVILIY